MIGQLIGNLENISQKNNAQTIFTSHSTSIIKRVQPESIRYFRLDINSCTTNVHSIILPDKEKLADQYKFVKEAVKAYPELYFAKLVILGEGDSEEIILPKFWNARNGSLDISGISVVPLGGRYVNHFWRLLNDLHIPYVTLLDLDRERDGGGWGRIKYVLNQLILNGYEKDKLLQTTTGVMSDDQFSQMIHWDSKSHDLLTWVTYLEQFDVFFSSPLDIDFLMLENYESFYKGLLSENEGPRIMITENGTTQQKRIADIEKLEKNCSEYQKRIDKDISSTLKDCGGDGKSYTENQQKLMVWYTYFFLNRGKPSTHIEAFSKMSNEEMLASMPDVIQKILNAAEKKLRGDKS